jgi:hypothetical protein
MKIRVYKRGSIWTVRAEGDSYQFSSLSVDSWEEAIRISDRMRTASGPLMLVEIGLLRQLGKRLDKNFTI